MRSIFFFSLSSVSLTNPFLSLSLSLSPFFTVLFPLSTLTLSSNNDDRRRSERLPSPTAAAAGEWMERQRRGERDDALLFVFDVLAVSCCMHFPLSFLSLFSPAISSSPTNPPPPRKTAVEEEAPPLKKAKIDEDKSAGRTPQRGRCSRRFAADGDSSKPPRPFAPADSPVKIGYKTFDSGAAAAKYFYTLINSVTQGQELNEYEFHNVVELLKAGHPEAERKLQGRLRRALPPLLAASVRAVVVRPHAAEGSPCFHLVRTDGSLEDFSTKKCVCALFPAYAALQAAKPPRRAGLERQTGDKRRRRQRRRTEEGGGARAAAAAAATRRRGGGGGEEEAVVRGRGGRGRS